MFTKISFDEQQEFWCHVCDSNLVNSDDKQTGMFFRMNGHVWENCKIGTFKPIVFAVCCDCLNNGEALDKCSTSLYTTNS